MVGTDELHDPVPLAAGTSFAAPRVALLCLLLRAAGSHRTQCQKATVFC